MILEKIKKYKRLLPLLSGVLIILAFPPFNWGFMAWFALLPLLASFYYDDFCMGFEKGFFYGVVINLGILYWLSVNQGAQWYYSTLSMISSVLFLALFYGLAGALLGYIGRKSGYFLTVFAFPFVFSGLEWLRSLGVLGFSWNHLCYTQAAFLPVMQMVAFTGPFGLGLWVYFLNSLIFLSIIEWQTSGKRLLGVFLIVFIFPWIFGLLVLTGADKDFDENINNRLTVTVVQPNVDPNEKWDNGLYEANMDSLFALSRREIMAHGSELVVWPETAVPTYLRINRRNSLYDINEFTRSYSVAIITGAPDYELNEEKEYEFYNSVFFLTPATPRPKSYRKMHLVPFGEYIPLSEHFEDLKKLNLGQGNFIAGKEISVFKLRRGGHTINITAAVCFESSFSALMRQGVQKGSQILAVVTNDAWFGNTSAPYLHAEISRFRAVENRIPVVRAANTGISMIIDKYGRVLQKSKFNEVEALTDDVNIAREKTFYTQTGNWIGMLCVIVVFLFVGLTFFRRNNEK